jgi:hypothetical protein
MANTTLNYLQPALRFYLKDTSEPYTYQTTEIQTALEQAVRFLANRWNNRYFIEYDSGDEEYVVSRNSNIDSFASNEPPVITQRDEAIIILQAAILIKTADIYKSTWDLGSWKDDEISYSNIQGGKSRDDSIRRDMERLEKLLKQHLHPGKIQSMPGFHLPYNQNEGSI